jgi:hypothetical protein
MYEALITLLVMVYIMGIGNLLTLFYSHSLDQGKTFPNNASINQTNILPITYFWYM